MWTERFLREFPDGKLGEPLARFSTFRIGGPADAFLDVQNRRSLESLVRFCREEHRPLTILGFGSNVLIADDGVRGVVARLKGEFETVEFLPERRVRAGAGARIPQLVLQCAERGLEGAEPLVGIPGTVGGAFVMNAGTREVWIGALTEEVEVLDPADGSMRSIPAARCGFEYRVSALEGLVVLGGRLALKAGDKSVIMGRVQEFQRRRQKTQPIHTFNVGSTFKNPPGRHVAQLIEEAGLKGAVSGGARISPMHANFIENFQNARAVDVLALVSLARQAVKKKFDVDLELEMKVL